MRYTPLHFSSFAYLLAWLCGLGEMAPLGLSAQVERGMASYYSDKYHLKSATASGEIYDRNQYTAAHKRLPFGTRVEVTNPSNGRAVTVRINDRGPYTPGRIIDLSYIAADQIGIVRAGVAEVKVEVLPDEPATQEGEASAGDPGLPLVDLLGRTEKDLMPSGSSAEEESPAALSAEGATLYTPALFRMVAFKSTQQGYAVQVGAFSSFYRLLEAMDQLSKRNIQNTLVHNSTKIEKPIFRILIGPFDSRAQADRSRQALKEQGLEGLTVNLRNLR
jgi:rare lipoprotein A